MMKEPSDPVRDTTRTGIWQKNRRAMWYRSRVAILPGAIGRSVIRLIPPAEIDRILLGDTSPASVTTK
jgi:hypothetical protein